MDEQNMVYAYNRIYWDSKRKEIQTHATTWMSLEDFMPCEPSLSQKDHLYDFIYMKYLVVKVIEIESRTVVARGWGRGKWEVTEWL